MNDADLIRYLAFTIGFGALLLLAAAFVMTIIAPPDKKKEWDRLRKKHLRSRYTWTERDE